MEELIKAIYEELTGNSALVAVVLQPTTNQLANGIYYDTAPAEATFPYIVYYIISNAQENTFSTSNNVESNLVQFSIFSKTQGIAEIKSIRSKLRTALERASLTYDSHTAAGGAVRMAGTSPIRTEDGWMATEDYMIWFTV